MKRDFLTHPLDHTRTPRVSQSSTEYATVLFGPAERHPIKAWLFAAILAVLAAAVWSVQ